MRAAPLVLALGFLAFGATMASTQEISDPAPVKVRYIVEDVDAAVAFYTHDLGFRLQAKAGPNFAMLSRHGLQLVLSPPVGPGGASQPASDGRRPEPGGWNRIILETHDLTRETESLRRAGVQFRTGVLGGPGGRQVVVEDPSGNPVELFQPTEN